MPAHDEDSQSNTIYKNGFEVAKYIANKKDKPKDLNNPNKESDYYYEKWSTLVTDIEQGNSPCAYYYQEALKAAALSLGLKVGTVVQAPMDGLIRYHFTNEEKNE